MPEATRVTVVDGTPQHPDEKRVLIESSYHQREVCKALPGRWWEPELRKWSCPATPDVAVAISFSFGQSGVTGDDAFTELLAAGADLVEARNKIFDPDRQDELIQIRNPLLSVTPRAVQTLGYNLLLEQPATMLAWDMGVGKTLPIVCWIVDEKVDPVLVGCPSKVVPVWPSQFNKHAPGAAHILALDPDDGYSVAKRTKLAKAFLDKPRPDDMPRVIVINLEAIWRKAFAEWAVTIDWGAVGCDESQRIAAPKTKVGLFYDKISSRAKKRFCMSGTPLGNNGPIDAFGQYRFLDHTIFGKGFVKFRSQYAIVDRTGGFPRIAGFQNQDDFNRRFYSIAHRCKIEEVVELPPCTDIDRTFKLGAEAQRIYNDLAATLVADYDDGVVTAGSKLARLIRFAQLTSGFAMVEDKETGEQSLARVDDGKANLTAQIIEDLPPDEPVVIFCRFRPDLDVAHGVAAALGRKSVEVSGRRKDVGAVWEKGEETVLVVQIKAGGVGVDFTRAAYVIWYSTGYELIDFKQAYARCYRSGQTRPVMNYFLQATGTVDQHIDRTLERTESVVESCLRFIVGGKSAHQLKGAES